MTNSIYASTSTLPFFIKGLCFHPATVMPARYCMGRCDGVDTFCIIDHLRQLRRKPGRRWKYGSRTGTLETCNLSICANTRKHIIDLLTPVGLSLALRRVQFFDSSRHIVSTLALNRAGFSEGSPPCGSLPFRYVVGRASHPLHSAQHACRPRVMVGTHQVIFSMG